MEGVGTSVALPQRPLTEAEQSCDTAWNANCFYPVRLKTMKCYGRLNFIIHILLRGNSQAS